jgi:predicted RecB family endonuclease
VQIKLWKKEKKRRSRDLYPVQNKISRRVVEYRRSSKRSQEMNFKDEDWYKKLKEKEKLLHNRVVECAHHIRKLGNKIDSLHRPKGTPYKTARGPKRRG